MFQTIMIIFKVLSTYSKNIIVMPLSHNHVIRLKMDENKFINVCFSSFYHRHFYNFTAIIFSFFLKLNRFSPFVKCLCFILSFGFTSFLLLICLNIFVYGCLMFKYSHLGFSINLKQVSY